jgi:hypothetical protein
LSADCASWRLSSFCPDLPIFVVHVREPGIFHFLSGEEGSQRNSSSARESILWKKLFSVGRLDRISLSDAEKLTQAEGEINVNREDKREKPGLG